jgi:phenylacetate-CoA ligase
MVTYNKNYWQEAEEKLSREKLEKLQETLLANVINYAYENVAFYRETFDKMGLEPSFFKKLSDIKHFPFTTKQDLARYYPYGFFAVPLKEIVRIHSSSGTTGKPTVVGYTRKDLEIWKDLIARIMVASNVTENDIVQIAFNYGLFTGGFGLHYGAEHLGASVIPASSGNSKKQITIMKDYKTTVLICTPTYALHLSEVMMEMGIKSDELSLKIALLGAESFKDSVRAELEEKLNILATDNYGLSEVMGPGVAGECVYKKGLHINEDHFFVEVINPDTEEEVKDGEKGELVITTLTKEAMPLIRYRTRDITRVFLDSCLCGRTFKKMEKPSGRTDDMFIINGVNIFPSQIDEVVHEFNGLSGHYMVYLKKKGYLDLLEINIEVDETIFFDEMKRQKSILDQIIAKMTSILGICPVVKLVSPKTIERFEGKAKRVVDLRDTF